MNKLEGIIFINGYMKAIRDILNFITDQNFNKIDLLKFISEKLKNL